MKVVAALTIASLLLIPLAFEAAYSQSGTFERSVTLKITDTRTGDVRTKVWTISTWTFGDRPIDVTDILLDKIQTVYSTDSFKFTLENKVFKGKWLVFEVELIANPLVGKGLDIRFM